MIGRPGAEFGYSVALDGDTLVVGADRWWDTAEMWQSGAAYVFKRTSSIWNFEQKLIPAELATGNVFGTSVAIKGDTAVVSMPMHSAGAPYSDAGAVVVFNRVGNTWTDQQMLEPSPLASDHLGVNMAVDGETLLATTQSYKVHAFRRSGGAWSHDGALLYDNATLEPSVAVNGNIALIGSPTCDDFGSNTGAVYLYARSNGMWQQSAQFTAADSDSYDQFGKSLAISGTTAIIGSPYDNNGVAGNGAASIFTIECSPSTCPQDLSGDDGMINVFDLFVLLANWNGDDPGATLAPPPNDVVDVFDLFTLLAAWGACP